MAVYITPDDMREVIAQIGPEQETTERLLKTCAGAKGIVDRVLGFGFDGYTSATEKTVRVWEAGSNYLPIPPCEAGSVLSVVRTLHGVETTITDYLEVEGGSCLYREHRWCEGEYTITADWGYGPVPDDIVQVTLQIATMLWNGRGNGGYTQVTGDEGSGHLRFTGGLTPQQRSVIEATRAQVRGSALRGLFS